VAKFETRNNNNSKRGKTRISNAGISRIESDEYFEIVRLGLVRLGKVRLGQVRLG